MKLLKKSNKREEIICDKINNISKQDRIKEIINKVVYKIEELDRGT